MSASPPRDCLGQIHLIFGPMFSGKSTELLRRIRRYTIAKRRCLLVKYKADTRYSAAAFSTHDKVQCPAVACGEELASLEASLADYDVVGIDEGQFLDKISSNDTFSEMAANMGKIVIIAALDGTFQRKPFGKVLNLVPCSESVTKLSAVCVLCQDDAAFSVRLSNETAVEVIGGADKYIAVCRTCYHETTSGRVDASKLAELIDSLQPKTATQPLTHQHRIHLPADASSHEH